MPSDKFTQKVVLELDDQISKPVDKVQGSFSKLGSFLKDKFTITLGDIANLFQSITGAVQSFTDAAQEQEDAVNQLDQALASLGDAAGPVSEALQTQAEALQATTKFSDEAIIATQALALNLGASVGDVEKLTEAALDLSAATGISLESATINLTKSLGGMAGELGEIIPGLRDLSEEALKAGGALDLVLENVGGAAQAQVATFSGLVAQLSNQFGGVQAAIGAAFTQNEGVRQSLTELGNLLNSEAFKGALDTLVNLLGLVVTELSKLVAQIPDGIRQLADLGRGFGKLGTGAGILGDAIAGISDKLRQLRELFIETNPVTNYLNALEAAGRAARETAEGIEETTQAQERGQQASSNYASQLRTTNQIEFQGIEIKEEAAQAAQKLADIQLEAGVAAAEEYARALGLVIDRLERVEQSAARTIVPVQQVNAETGGALRGIRARDPRHQADVDAALAQGRRPYQGGTRIRTADGTGSRLLVVQ